MAESLASHLSWGSVVGPSTDSQPCMETSGCSWQPRLRESVATLARLEWLAVANPIVMS